MKLEATLFGIIQLVFGLVMLIPVIVLLFDYNVIAQLTASQVVFLIFAMISILYLKDGVIMVLGAFTTSNEYDNSEDEQPIPENKPTEIPHKV
jgi:uncharacterized membrane protein YqjE